MEFPDPESDFLMAASVGDLTLLKRLTSEIEYGGGFMNDYEMVKDAEGRSALHLAAAAGKTRICKFLVEKLKFNVDLRDLGGNTPLIVAILEQRHLTAVYLIEKGAGIDCRNRGGCTALHYAAEKGQKEMLRLLLSKGAKIIPDVSSVAGTALHSACFNGKKESVKILLDNGADPNAATALCFTPLMMSIVAESYECMELLLKAGADVNLGAIGKTPLIVAASEGDTGIIKYLLKAGANPNIADISGMTPLEHAALCGNVAAALVLFPCTSPISSFPDWSVNGIMNRVHSREANAQREIRRKKEFEASKAKGREAFERKDYDKAIFWYTQASHADPNDETVLSNRSLCWAMLKEGGYALIDAVACVAVKPDWAKAHYREGAAYMLLNEYSFASEAFSKALELDPDNKEIKEAHREAVEAEFGMPVSEYLKTMHI